MQNQTGAIPPQNKDVSSPAVNPQAASQMGFNNPTYQLEQAIGAQVQKILQLAQNGIITNEQGQYLMANLARKAKEINDYKNSVTRQVQPMQPQAPTAPQVPEQAPQLSPMEMFNQERPGFFDGEGRVDILNYIQGYNMDKDEILQISKLVEKLENSAVNKYLKQSDYEKSLNDENAAAKSRLTAYAQSSAGDSNTNRIFTREDIGAMSGEEFTKNEKMIMEQLKQGLIR